MANNFKKEKIIFVVLISFCILFLATVRSYAIMDDSMYPNFKSGSRVIVLNLYGLNGLFANRGTVVIINNRFVEKDVTSTLVKRIIAVSGDTLSFDGGKLLLNGAVLPEKINFFENKEISIPEKSSFVLGDNANYSIDSRDFGPISANDIRGIVLFGF